MVPLKVAKRIILGGSLVFAFLILGYQGFVYLQTGDWHWIALADIFPTWTENLSPEGGGLQAIAYWFLAKLWLGIIVIAQGIHGFFFAKEDAVGFPDGDID